MIHALRTIGEYVVNSKESELADMLMDNPNDNEKYNIVLLIVFSKQGDQLTFKGIEMEEFGSYRRYAYKKGSPNGGDLTPTSKKTDEFQKTLKRIRFSLDNICANIDKPQNEEDAIVQSIHQLFEDEAVYAQILNELAAQNSLTGVVLTVAVDEEKTRKYVGDFEVFRKALVDQYEKGLHFRSSFNKVEQNSIGHNNQCYVCSKVSEKTYGYASTFAFYTLDKPGFTSGGFQRQYAWRNYPVCPECGFTLEIGKKYIENNLHSRLCNMDYYIMPKSIFEEGRSNTEDIFAILADLEDKRKISLGSDTVDRLTGAEEDLLGLMQDYNNFINFNVLFYSAPPGKNEFRILLYVEDVLPSYIQKLFQAKHAVEAHSYFRNLPGKDQTRFDLRFGFDAFAHFFPFDGHAKTLIGILNNVLTQRQIAYPFMISGFMELIRSKFINDEPVWYDVRKAFSILLFLNELSLLKGKKDGEVKMTIAEKVYEKQFTDFFAEHASFFDADVKRAIFLEGVLAEKLLNYQKYERDGATPFRERLNGLKMDERILKRLLPEMQNKLEEYKANYYVKLEALIAYYMLDSDFSTLSNDEMSFYFTMGMNLASEFISKLKDEEEEKHDESDGKAE